MSYIQIELGGKLRGLKFTQGTNILLQDRLAECDESERKAFGVQFIIWAGLKTNCIIKGERFTKTVDNPNVGKPNQPDTIEAPASFEDVCEWVEVLHQDVIIQVVELYTEVNPTKEDEPSTEPEKKNQPDIVTEPNVTSLPVES